MPKKFFTKAGWEEYLSLGSDTMRHFLLCLRIYVMWKLEVAVEGPPEDPPSLDLKDFRVPGP